MSTRTITEESKELPVNIEFELSENGNKTFSGFELNETLSGFELSGNDTGNWSLFELPPNQDNTTDPLYLFYGYPFVIPMAFVMVIIIILAIGGNVMVILTIVRHRGMRTRTNMFIVNLAVADILVAVLDMPVSLTTIIEGRWVFGDDLCKLNGFTMALFLICSIHTLMYISVHKFISITRPFSRAMTPARIKMMILASWFWATLCAIGPLVGMNENVYKRGASQCGPAIPKVKVAYIHSGLITFSNYIIPLSVMFFCYFKIFREIHVHMKRIRETSNIDLENSVAQQKKVTTTLLLVLACFLLCWTPFVIYSNLAVMIKEKEKLPPLFNPLAYWCGYLNSACNPIIYAFRSPSFRKGYKEIMCGDQSAKLSVVNSMSFRSRSGTGTRRGSTKSNSNTQKTQDAQPKPPEVRRQRTLLSQTSWMSTPMLPYLARKFSSKQETNKGEKPSISPSSPNTGCGGLCGFWKPRPNSAEVNIEVDQVSTKHKRGNSSCQDIKEEDENDPLNDDRMNDDDDRREEDDAV